jgi:hypothetical protein
VVTRPADRDRRRIYCTLLLHRTTYSDDINGSMLASCRIHPRAASPVRVLLGGEARAISRPYRNLISCVSVRAVRLTSYGICSMAIGSGEISVAGPDIFQPIILFNPTLFASDPLPVFYV